VGALTALGLAAIFGDADAGDKKKGKKGGKKGGGKKSKGKKKRQFCVSIGESCTFSVNPCCGDALCCDPTGSGFRECLPPGECCAGNTCSSENSLECSVGCTCQNRDSLGFGKCLLA
jgi:hypothetical protein